MHKRYLSIYAAPDGVLTDPLHWCTECNSLVPSKFMTNHSQFHDTYTYRKDGNMSNVLWCDPGNHAFKSGARGSLHWSGTQVGEDGRHQTVDMDACVDHNPMRAEPEHIVKELQTDYPTA